MNIGAHRQLICGRPTLTNRPRNAVESDELLQAPHKMVSTSMLLALGSEAQLNINCTLSVSNPVDISPIRSPQDVHSVLANDYFARKRLVEIGTRNGDGMSCFVRTASHAIAYEAEKKYCTKLEARQRGEGTNYTVSCTLFGSADMASFPDADVYHWWFGRDFLNKQLLYELCRRVSCGQLRASAIAVVLFDPKEKHDVASLRDMRRLGWISREQEVAYDEQAKCNAMLEALRAVWPASTPIGPQDPDLLWAWRWDHNVCERAKGSFTIATFPVSKLSASPKCKCDASRADDADLKKGLF